MDSKEILKSRDEGRVFRVRRKKFKKRQYWMRFSDLRVKI